MRPRCPGSRVNTSSSPASEPRGLAIVSALLLVYVVWGSTYLAIRIALDGGVPPLLGVSGLRFVAAGTVLYAFLRWRGVAAPTRAQWASIVVMGVLMLGLGNGLVVLAEREVSSGLAAVAVAAMPLWMGLFSAMRGQRPSGVEWLGLGLGFLGVAWLSLGGSLAASPRGLALLLVAALAWAAGSVWSRGRDLPAPFMVAAAQMLAGGVLLVLAGLLHGERFQAMPSLGGWGAWVYLGVFGSIIAFTAYVWLLHHVRPALAGSYAYVNPVIAVLLGVWLGGEHVGVQDVLAMLVVLGGVVVISLARARRR